MKTVKPIFADRSKWILKVFLFKLKFVSIGFIHHIYIRVLHDIGVLEFRYHLIEYKSGFETCPTPKFTL